MFRITKPALVLGVLGALALAPIALAAEPAPQNLNPPPPDFYTCKPVGEGTICRGNRHESKVAELQPELVCGSAGDAFNIYDNGEVYSRFTRRYDAAGNLTRRVNHEVWRSAFWSNPLTGKTVPYTQRGTMTTVLTLPGDFSSAVETQVGENIYTDPVTHKKVLRSAGRTVFGPDGLEFSAGRQWFIDLFENGDTSVLDGVCAALS